MKNDHAFDAPSLEVFEDVVIELDMEPSMDYVLTSTDGFVCDLTLHTLPNESVLDTFKQGVNHSVLQVDPNLVKRCEQSKEIIQIKRDVNDCVCIIAVATAADTETVYALAITRGAKAFIAKDPPKMNLAVPVFLVTTSTLEKISEVSDALVNIQEKPKVHVKYDSDAVIHSGNVNDDIVLDGSESLPINLVNTNESHPLMEESIGDIDLNPLVCLNFIEFVLCHFVRGSTFGLHSIGKSNTRYRWAFSTPIHCESICIRLYAAHHFPDT